MIKRYFVEKKEAFRIEAAALTAELQDFLALSKLENVRIINCYLLEGVADEYVEAVGSQILSEAQVDNYYDEQAFSSQIGFDASRDFVISYLPGQFDQRAAGVAECVQLITKGEKPLVKTAKLYKPSGDLTVADIEKIKNYIINPLECEETDFDELLNKDSLQAVYPQAPQVEKIEGFLNFGSAELEQFAATTGLAMDLADLEFCQSYFRSEDREPTISEIKVIDTYWSDHCRHTCFLTELTSVEFEDELVRTAYQDYLAEKAALEAVNGKKRPVSFMDIATAAMKILRVQGKLDKLDESEEINACSVKIKLRRDGQEEDWLLLFKNETHNHPTEIEPYGGAATCIGGAIRDPLSGRAYVYAAMRVTGAADPTLPLEDTLPGKLPQRKICQGAAQGYSAYGNQIGIATGLVDELYHPDYVAKRLEVGAVIGATPLAKVKRETPTAGDVVILLGGATGRDGLGGATGSSKAHNKQSLSLCGAEVQKGNAPEERKLQRLFRNFEACSLIKRCNDFGAGGVSVAIGELADSLLIDLDKVPKKYAGLDGTEIAISESQERMAVVVAAADVEKFLQAAEAENLQATVVAEVTNSERLQMLWRGVAIVDLSREFLNSNGAAKRQAALVSKECFNTKALSGNWAEDYKRMVSDLNVCSKRGLAERFDATIGAGTVLHPFGGKYQLTPVQAMVHLVNTESGDSSLCSAMSYAFNPHISDSAPYHGAYLAVVESVAKLLAVGVPYRDIYLSFQEYFCKPGTDKRRWGRPLAALLGAFKAQMDLGIAAIGGKDSMSGTFMDIDVPNTLISFAVSTLEAERVISPEFKGATPYVYCLKPLYRDKLPRRESLTALFKSMAALSENKVPTAAYALSYGGIAEAVYKMCIGNNLGFEFAASHSVSDLFAYNYGAFVVAADSDLQLYLQERESDFVCELLGRVTYEPLIKYGDEVLELDTLSKLYEARLESVYRVGNSEPATSTASATSITAATLSAAVTQVAPLTPAATAATTAPITATTTTPTTATPKNAATATETPNLNYTAVAVKNSKPQVLIPVFPGTNCEYDSAKLVENSGAAAELFVINNLSSEHIKRSVEQFANLVARSQIVFIPGGFSGADEPEGSAKLIAAFFRNPEIAAEITKLLDERGGLMLGICNGFQALIKLGLLPYGHIKTPSADDPTLTFNGIARHQAKIVRTVIVDNHSPWLQNVRPGEVYNVAISHGEGRFVADNTVLEALRANKQIVSRYVDMEGRPTADIRYNPNGSVEAIEAVCSPDGRILGKMGHSERIGKYLYRNVPGAYDMQLFKAAVKYFNA